MYLEKIEWLLRNLVIYLNDNERRQTQNKSLNIWQSRRFGLKEA